ncbi:monooxygenase, partial [Helicosporidium sp. ATCC 50920]
MRGAALLGLCSRRRFQAGPRAASETGLLASSAWVRSTRALSSKTASATDGSARLRALEQPWPVVIVGGGPTGLTLGLLLRGLGVSSLILESRQWLTEHPQAHLINHRAMEIFRPLAGLSRDIQDAQPDFEDWRRFVYCQGLTGPLLGTVDHFPRQTDASRPDLSPEPLAHLSQHRLVPLLAARLDALHQCPGVSCHAGSLAIWGAEPAARPVQNDASSRARCEMVMGARAARLEEAAGGRGATLHVDVSPDAAGATTTSSKAFALSTSFVVAADGASSALRRSLGIGSTGEPDMQRLINVHFVWPELASALRSQRREGMLYFVYSSEATAVLVAHDLRRGEFVAQIPHFAPKGVESFPEAACVDILRKVAGGSASSDELPGFSSAPARAPSSFPSLRASSPRILDVRAWRMGGFVADSYHRARTALAGDAAHAFPPAGALGMNTGVGDAQALAW